MNWNNNTLVHTLPSLYVSPAGEHVPLPYVSLSQNSGTDSNIEITVLNYRNNQPTDPNLWNRMNHALSIFGNEEFRTINAANIACSLKRVAGYIA